jgi:ribosome-binding factor A
MKVNYQNESKNSFVLQKSSRLQRVLADIFSKSSFSFGEKKVFVNVIYVDLSGDLSNAKVVIDSFGLDAVQQNELVKRLNKDFVKQIRSLVAQKIQMKRAPNIVFCLSEENKKGERVLNLIEKLKDDEG